ncbi:prepilin peptidase [Saccharomonospora sp. NB11]|uniref:prepilin peptidase n=1 Tax=Saccharomonospora sp. NB11 TaxID=1642298 RepID=UPI0018D121C7|nr:A24 family peptidase [Saccharomonospora sp. NB11]
MNWGMLAVVGVAIVSIGIVTGWWAARLLDKGVRPAPVPAWGCAVGTGVLWAVVCALAHRGTWPPWWTPVPLAATAFAVPLALADLRHRRLPAVLTIPSYPLGAVAVAVAAFSGPGVTLLVTAVVGGVAAWGVHAVIHRVAPTSLGAGDVTLSGSLGLLAGAAGWPTLVVVTVLASAVTAVLAGVGLAARVLRWRDGVPHGPGLLAATCVGVLFPGGLPSVGS